MIQVKVAYISDKPPLVDKHVSPLTVFVGLLDHTSFGGSSGIMSAARPELSYPCISQAKSQDEIS